MRDKTISLAKAGGPPGGAPQSASLIRLIYSSHSNLPGRRVAGQQAGLADILRVAWTNNAALGVTGARVLYDDLFAQVLEGRGAVVTQRFSSIKADARHDRVALDQSGPIEARLFGQWAMAIVAEHHEPDMPLVATTGGLSQGAPWQVTSDQEKVLTRLRDLTRG